MVRVTVERVVRCSPAEFLALVMDAERYATVDAKLGRIYWVRRSGNHPGESDSTENTAVTDFRFRSRLPGLPGPGLKVVSRMRLTPGERVDVAYAPPPANRLVRRLSRFSASFVCTPVSGGTRITRTIEIGFPPVLGLPVEAVLRRTLRPDVERELDGAKALLEAAQASSG